MTNEERVFLICAECDQGQYFEEIKTVSAGDESWHVCPACRTIEGNTMYVNEEGKKVDV